RTITGRVRREERRVWILFTKRDWKRPLLVRNNKKEERFVLLFVGIRFLLSRFPFCFLFLS
ncbi:hypothetical protein CSUI_005070, partial [Cystoisospora suis]